MRCIRAGWLVAAAAVAVAWGPVASADDRERGRGGQRIDLNRGGTQHVRIVGSITGADGLPEATNFDFTIDRFANGANGAVCAVGTLRGGRLAETPVGIPVQVPGRSTNSSDCQGLGGATGGKEDHGGFGGSEHGAVERRGATTPVKALPLEALVIPAQFPPPPPRGGCNILNLDLGPLDLNVLGLVVHLDPVVLDITGLPQQGLLGNLLCALLGP